MKATLTDLFKPKDDNEYEAAVAAFTRLKEEMVGLQNQNSLDQAHLSLMITYGQVMIQKGEVNVGQKSDYDLILNKVNEDSSLKKRKPDDSSLLHSFRTFHDIFQNIEDQLKIVDNYLIKSKTSNAKKLQNEYENYFKSSAGEDYVQYQNTNKLVDKVLKDKGELKHEDNQKPGPKLK